MTMRVIMPRDENILYISHNWGVGAAITENFTLRLSELEVRELEKIIHEYNEHRKDNERWPLKSHRS